MRYWWQLSVDYMTEESDHPDDPYTLVVHPLQWRLQSKARLSHFHRFELLCLIFTHSAGLCDFLAWLDQQYDDRVKKEGITMAKKNRKIGFNSTTLPPSDAPDWTLDQEWKG